MKAHQKGLIMIHTSESLKSQDGEFENFHYQLEDGEQYRLTDSELGWLNFVDGRYSIADHMRENMHDGVYTVDSTDMGLSLEADSLFCKAVCLSDDTTLQAIFFYSSIEPD
tara:strand:- start:782 stop:1114 length:333 start_codon:yes stop_codon:yes gene_type:complete